MVQLFCSRVCLLDYRQFKPPAIDADVWIGHIRVARNAEWGDGLLSLPPSVPPVGVWDRVTSFPFPGGLGAVPQKTGVRWYNPGFLFGNLYAIRSIFGTC